MTLFKHFIVVRNPASTHAERTTRRLAELQHYAPGTSLIIVETIPGGRKANQRLLRPYANQLGPETLLCIAAGDGTINLVADILLNDSLLPETARQTPILPLWCGNGNDLACMLNGPARTSLKRLLAIGHTVAITPLQIDLLAADGSRETRLAVSYASFGASAFAARVLGRRIRRRHLADVVPGSRFVRELAATTYALTKAPKFSVLHDGKRQSMFEHMFLNGSRFAKVNGSPLRITDEGFYYIAAKNKHFWQVMHQVGRTLASRHLTAGQQSPVNFTLLEPVWAQLDGETIRLDTGTQVTIGPAGQSIRALATRRNL